MYCLLRFVILVGVFFGIWSQPNSAERDPGQFWSENSKNSPTDVVLNFDLAPGWKMYGPDNSPGLVPHLVTTHKNNVSDVGIKWPSEKKFELYGEQFNGYDTPVKAHVKITPRDHESTSRYSATLNFAVCNDICLPASIKIDWIQGIYGQGLGYLLLMAFIGGLILNIMPCVLPILSLKVFSMIKKTPSLKSIIATIGGSFTFFIFFAGIVVLLRGAGVSAGWGMHFQNPYFVTFFVWLLLIITARFFHLFQMKSPTISLPFASKYPIGQNYIEGFILALLATPCTAPYLSLAAGVAFTLPTIETFLIFIFLWAGFVLPYGLMSISPRFLQKILPAPGKWMITLEKILGVILLLSALWMVWVLMEETSLLIALSVLLCGVITITFIYLYPHLRRWILLLSLGCIFLPSLPHDVREVHEFPLTVNELQKMAMRGEISFIKVHAAWCLTCHANDLVLESDEVEELFRKARVHRFSFDWTQRQKDIGAFLGEFDRDGVPFYLLMGPRNKNGIVLPELLSTQDLKKALAQVGGSA